MGGNDVLRVLQGLGMVAEQMMKTQGSAATEGIGRLRCGLA